MVQFAVPSRDIMCLNFSPPILGLFSFQPHPCRFNWNDSCYVCLQWICQILERHFVSLTLECHCLTHCLRALSLEEIGTSSKGFGQGNTWDNCVRCLGKRPFLPRNQPASQECWDHCISIWGRGIPGRGNSKCRGFAVGISLMVWAYPGHCECRGSGLSERWGGKLGLTLQSPESHHEQLRF